MKIRRGLSPSSRMVAVAAALVLALAALAAISVRQVPGVATARETPALRATQPAMPTAPAPQSTAPQPAGSATRGPTPAPFTPAVNGTFSLATVLATLSVGPEHRAGYKSALFHTWIDADGNGCNTRAEVLIAEAVVKPTVGSKCHLTGGTWFSLYDGVTITDPARVEIDHVVALAEAWDSGAWAWDAARREAYANDLGVPWTLIAVSSPSNESKADKDPADWLPPSAADTCRYLADYVAVKARWSLSVDPAEQRAIARQAACQGTPVQVVHAGAGSP